MAEDTDDRIVNLLALILLSQMGGASLGAKANHLRRAGFTNVEIADLLGTTAASVNQAIYASTSRRARPLGARKSRKK